MSSNTKSNNNNNKTTNSCETLFTLSTLVSGTRYLNPRTIHIALEYKVATNPTVYTVQSLDSILSLFSLPSSVITALGGDSSFLYKLMEDIAVTMYFISKSTTSLDFSVAAINFCKLRGNTSFLTILQGVAQKFSSPVQGFEDNIDLLQGYLENYTALKDSPDRKSVV